MGAGATEADVRVRVAQDVEGVRVFEDLFVEIGGPVGHHHPLALLDPHTFNILRDPNPHVGFGGTGAHYCIGANLARMTINLIFNAVADHMPDLKPIGEPERLRSGWLNGIKHWQVDYAGKPAVTS
ncbi:hypothetical protein A5659_06170 [Mycobacterium sp. 1165196.3]|nr:hypothetical protein A5659_06170 [Mycobacterium sp. 1165196.3]